MKTNEEYSKYRLISLCSCGWFNKPGIRDMFAGYICPECGNRTETKVGKYIIRKTTTFFSCRSEIVGLQLKEQLLEKDIL